MINTTIYKYTDIQGDYFCEKYREPPKKFAWRTQQSDGSYDNKAPESDLPIFNIHKVRNASEIWVLEGEKDVTLILNLIDKGFLSKDVVPTCGPNGSSLWAAVNNHFFTEKEVVFFPDNDEPGRNYAFKNAEQIFCIASLIKIVELPGLKEKGDITDWLDKDGNTVGMLLTLVQNQKPWEPDFAPKSHSALEIFNTDFPDVKWAVPGILPDGLNILGGKPKQGKSMLALNIALGIVNGGNVLDQIEVEKGIVVFLALEDVPRRLKSRLQQMAHGLDIKSLKDLYIFTSFPRMGEGGIRFVEYEIKKHKNPRLLIIDTFALFKPKDSGKNSNLYDQDYEQINLIKKIADKFGVSILLIHHLRKSDADDIMDTFSGSLGLTGAADGLLVLKGKSGQSDAELHITGRDIESKEYSLKLDTRSLSWKIMGNPTEVKSTNQRQVLFDAIKDNSDITNPIAPKELAVRTGLSKNFIYKTLPLLEKEGNIKKLDRGKYYYSNKFEGFIGKDGKDGKVNGDDTSIKEEIIKFGRPLNEILKEIKV